MSTSKDPYENLLEQQMNGIRSRRQEAKSAEKTRQEHLDAEWKKTIESARKLQVKFASHPKIQHFTISKNEDEISIKLIDSSLRRGYSFYILGRNHSEKKYPGMDVVWLCELGVNETHYREPSEAMAELVRNIAYKLA